MNFKNFCKRVCLLGILFILPHVALGYEGFHDVLYERYGYKCYMSRKAFLEDKKKNESSNFTAEDEFFLGRCHIAKGSNNATIKGHLDTAASGGNFSAWIVLGEYFKNGKTFSNPIEKYSIADNTSRTSGRLLDIEEAIKNYENAFNILKKSNNKGGSIEQLAFNRIYLNLIVLYLERYSYHLIDSNTRKMYVNQLFKTNHGRGLEYVDLQVTLKLYNSIFADKASNSTGIDRKDPEQNLWKILDYANYCMRDIKSGSTNSSNKMITICEEAKAVMNHEGTLSKLRSAEKKRQELLNKIPACNNTHRYCFDEGEFYGYMYDILTEVLNFKDFLKKTLSAPSNKY